MALETFLFDVFASNKASGKIARQADKTRDFYRDRRGEQAEAIEPYRETGRQGLDLIGDLIRGGPDEVGESGEAILADIARRVTGRHAAMGLRDSGAHTNALTEALLRGRRGLRSQTFGEGATVAGLGQNAISQTIRSDAIAGEGIGKANATIGEAKAFPWLNASNALYRWEDQILNAAGKAAGGGFG